MADYNSVHTGQTVDERVAQVATNTSDIASLKGRMTSAETALSGKASTTSVSDIEAKIPSSASASNKLVDSSTLASSISGKASTADLTNLTSRVTTVEGKIPTAASASNQLADKGFVSNGLNGKQPTLVSGTNIKTVNGESLLGSGNIIAGDPNAVKYVAQTLTSEQQAQARQNIGAASPSELSGQYYGFFTSSSSLPTGISIAGYAFVGESEPFSVWNFDGSEWADSGATVNAIVGEPGVGFNSVSSNQDGTLLITLSNGDTITVDLNHNHPQYAKYVYCQSQAAYDAITTKDSGTIYLILETE